MDNGDGKTGTRKIVIVEDNDNVAKITAKSLADKGFETKVISYGSAAIFYALENNNSLMILEYQLPDMTAKDVITNLLENGHVVPFIVMSPPGNEKVIIEMMKLGARDFLVKEQGFLDILPEAVKKVVEQLNTEELLTETQKSLRYSENKFKDIFHAITDAIILYDFEGNIKEANQATEIMLGYNYNDIRQKNFFDLQTEDFKKNYKLYLSELISHKQIYYQTDAVDFSGKKFPVACISKLIDFVSGETILTIMKDMTYIKAEEDQLRENEERWQRIANTVTDYIFTVYVENGEPQRTVHSSNCKGITGYSPEEFAANPYLWIEMVDDRDREKVLQNVKRILSGEDIGPFEHRIVRKDSRKVWLRNNPVLNFDDSGNLISYDGVVQDITERKRYETELLEKQARLNAIVKGFDGLIYVCSQDYKIEYMNDKFIERTGYDATGEHCYKAIHELDEVCPWCVNERVQKGETVRWELQSPKDNRWYSVVNTPIFHKDGRISKQSLIIDITDIKFADQEINRLNKLYFRLLEELDFPVCRFLSDGSLVSANKVFQEVFCLDSNSPLNEQNIFSCLPEELSSWTERNLSLLGEKKIVIEKRIEEMRLNDTSLLNKSWLVMAIVDSENSILEYQAILKDLNGREKS